MRIRIACGEEEKCLVRVRQYHLLDIVCVPGETGQGARAWQHFNDPPLPFPDIHHAHAVTCRNDVGPTSVALERTGDGGQQFAPVP
jgi:hypothetical protein